MFTLPNKRKQSDRNVHIYNRNFQSNILHCTRLPVYLPDRSFARAQSNPRSYIKCSLPSYSVNCHHIHCYEHHIHISSGNQLKWQTKILNKFIGFIIISFISGKTQTEWFVFSPYFILIIKYDHLLHILIGMLICLLTLFFVRFFGRKSTMPLLLKDHICDCTNFLVILNWNLLYVI